MKWREVSRVEPGNRKGTLITVDGEIYALAHDYEMLEVFSLPLDCTLIHKTYEQTLAGFLSCQRPSSNSFNNTSPEITKSSLSSMATLMKVTRDLDSWKIDGTTLRLSPYMRRTRFLRNGFKVLDISSLLRDCMPASDCIS